MKKYGLIALLIGLLSASIAADRPGAIHWEEERTVPAVIVTGRVAAFEGLDNLENTPEDCYAARVAERRRRFEWTPGADPARLTGGVRLLDADVAADGSALALLEQLGEKDGPYGSRLLIFNLFNGEILRAEEFTDRQLTRIALLPDSTRILALQAAQPQLNSPAAWVSIDGATGRIVAESAAMPGDASDWLATPGAVWVKIAGRAEIRKYDSDDPAAAPQRFELNRDGRFVLFDPAGEVLVNVAPGTAEIYRLDSGRLSLMRSVTLPDRFRPDFGVLAEMEEKTPVLGQSGGRTLVVWGENCREIESRSRGPAVWHPASKRLFLTVDARNSLNIHSLPGDVAPEDSISLDGLRPGTRGEPFRLFAAGTAVQPEILVLDRRANIYRLQLVGKRWRKHLIYSPISR